MFFPVSFNIPSSSVRSDCEVNDVVEMAKDDRLTDKLYTETLRALKLDAIKIWAGVTGAVECLETRKLVLAGLAVQRTPNSFASIFPAQA